MQGQEKGKPSEFKQKWFDFTKELSSNQLNISLYKLFIVIESLQFLGYHNNGLILYNTYGFEQLGKALQFLNLLPLMLEGNVNNLLVPVFTAITLGHMALIVLGYKAYHRKMEKMSKSVQDRNFHKNRLEYFINFIMVCLNTFLTIPICQTSVTAIYCQNSAPYTTHQDCYSTVELLIAFLGAINILWLLVSNFYFALYYYDRNPFSTNFLTCSSNWWNLGKFAIKITPMLYFGYDATLSYPVLFLVVINGCYIGYLGVFRVVFPYYRYNFDLEKFVYFTEAFVLCVNVHFVAIYAIQGGAASNVKSFIFVFWVAGSILLSRLALKYLVSKKEDLITEINSIEKVKLDLVLEYIIYLIFEVEKGFSRNKGAFYLASIAKTHKEHCENADCYCSLYFKRAKDKNAYRNKQVFYTLLLAIVDRVIGENKKAYPFFILKAYILYYKMESQIKAATTIAMIMQDKLDFSDEMLVKGLLFELNHQYVDSRDMEVYRKFNEYLLRQEEESMKLVNLYLQYWQELIDQKSSIPKLHRLLVSIKESKDELGQIVQGSLAIYRNHVRVLLLYRNFLKEVLNDYMGYLRYEQKYKIGLKQHKLSNVDAVNTIQFRANQNLLVINFTRHFSAHSEILGNFKILSISSNVKEFLGFTNAELKDQSLNKLIPRIYHNVHDTFVDRILDRRDSEITSRQFRIFPVNSEGYIIECNVISKFMPSVIAGINIVSFIEQCDRHKDEFFIIYDKDSGMVDSMNEDAEKMLKDVSRRKTNDMLAIPDHINDLLPNWDFKNEVWKEHLGRGKSLKSIASLNDFKYDLREIEVVRSDGLQVKNIKILKFKGDFFVRMFSFQNYESYKESNTIQQYLEYQKDNSYSKMDSNQLQDLISVETQNLIERDREKKKTMKRMEKSEKVRKELIEVDPPRSGRLCFLLVESILCFLALGFTVYEFVIANTNIDTYLEDSYLIINMNAVQFGLSDSTFIMSLVTSLMAYDSNMTLPYQNFKSSIELLPEMEEVDEKYRELNDHIHIVNSMFIEKIEQGELKQSSLEIEVKYLLQPKEKKYYLQKTEIFQAMLQYVTYGQDISYRIVALQDPIQDLLLTPDYFYIFANNIDILPRRLLSIKEDILQSIDSRLNGGFTEFLIIKVVNAVLILVSALGLLVYYRHIYREFVLRVLEMYQSIRIEQIKVFQEKCHKYKTSLSDKGELQRSKSGENEEEKGASKQEASQGALEMDQSVISESVFNAEDEEEVKLAAVPEQVQHFLTFEQLPRQCLQLLTMLAWLSLYGVLLFGLCYTYSQGTDTLEFQISNLNKYSNVLNSVVQMRLFSELSLNMIGYWDAAYLESINAQVQDYFSAAVRYMDDGSLNLTTIKSEFARKYEEMRYLQSLVLNKDWSTLNVIANQIEASLEDMDPLIQFLSEQSAQYLPVVEASAQKIGRTMNICIGLEMIFIMVYWYLAVRRAYSKLLKEHRSTYEMYNIISYNLRKEVMKP